MRKFSSRHVVVIDLPLANEVAILHPEQVVLRFGDQGTVDVGALCYLQRHSAKRKSNGGGRKVDFNSFNQKRADRVRTLIDYFSEEFTHGGRRATTLRIMVQIFVKSFMGWADANGYANVLDGESTGRTAFRAYNVYLRECISLNSISVNAGAQHQNFALDLLGGFLNTDDLHRGINLLRYDMQAKESIRPPCEDAQAKVLALCGAMFDGFTELVLEPKLYPFRLTMPKYLGWTDNTLWVFPTHKWCIPPHQVADRPKFGKPYWAYDYIDGRLATMEELLQQFGHNYTNSYNALLRAQNCIAVANTDFQIHTRRNKAMMAHNAFVLMFIANTAMNLAQVLELSWNGDYEVGVDRQGFRAIKGRAGNRIVYFEITTAFLPKLKRYLLLRDYFLNGMPCDRLFFSMGVNLVGPPKKMKDYAIDNLFDILMAIDPQFRRVNPREWRAAKSDWLIRKSDPATAAIVLQNSERTVLRAYATGSETIHIQEMSNFFERVADLVVSKGRPIARQVDLAVGACSSFRVPIQVTSNVPVTPDCRDPEGCLFCDKFRVHADEHDTRKLLSYRYCIQRTSHLATTEEHFQRLFGSILDRVQKILDEIDRREPGMVGRVIQGVEEGELDPYWAGKLEMLMELELV